MHLSVLDGNRRCTDCRDTDGGGLLEWWVRGIVIYQAALTLVHVRGSTQTDAYLGKYRSWGSKCKRSLYGRGHDLGTDLNS